MKFLKKTLVILLTACITFCSSSCLLLTYFRLPPRMSERVYERINEEDFYNLVEEIYQLCENKSGRKQLEKKRETLFIDYYNRSSTMAILAELNYYKDVTNQSAQEESVYADNLYTTIVNETLKVEKAIFNSVHKDYFVDAYGEDYLNMINEALVATDEELEMNNQMNELSAQYNSSFAQGDYGKVAQIMISLIKLRNQYASEMIDESGFSYDNYLDFAYENVFGREYTPSEALQFCYSVKEHVYPLLSTMMSSYDRDLKSPACTMSDVKNIVPKIIEQIDDDMLSNWEYMIDRELYDFDVGENKANTSFVVEFLEYGDAFMFINPTGQLSYDLSTVIHEFGHYNEVFEGNDENAEYLFNYDLAETHSQGFELISLPAVEKILSSKYGENAYKSYAQEFIYNCLWAMLSNCAFTEFEYIIYNASESALTPEYLEKQFKTVFAKYWPNGEMDYYSIPHIFSYPGYCVSYSVSLTFAAEIWAAENNVEVYKNVVEYSTNALTTTVCAEVGLQNPILSTSVKAVADQFNNYINNTF